MIDMKFIVDNMLGKLAKWLRFLGYDTLYPKILNDKQLAQLSLAEDRVLLTRDKELASKKDIKVLYIISEQLDDQLKQVILEFGLKLGDSAFTRCPECNYMLKKIEKTDIEGKLPSGVIENQDKFWVCNNCEQYYWQGTHFTKIKDKLENMFN
jgi:uncharacterized protein with PIN domain